MPLLLPTSSSKTTSTVVIAGVLSVASAVILTVPSVSHFVWSCFPIIYDNTVFLVKPPYLYLVINCIIVCIVATSKLTHKSTSIDDSYLSQVVTPEPVPVPVPSDIHTGFLNVAHVADSYLSEVVTSEPVPVPVPSDNHTGFLNVAHVASSDYTRDDITVEEDERKFHEAIVDGKEQKPETEETPNSSEDSPEKPRLKNDDSQEISIPKHRRKPPRFNKQKSAAALGVTKPPKRQDTMDTTWKKITEGRSAPLTKHLTKSDTWQERAHVQRSSEKQKEKVTKSENLNDVNAPTEEKMSLKREPSPGQEELNRRVEAFIKKFNEEMRLQRLESLAKYNEMVNGGTRL